MVSKKRMLVAIGAAVLALATVSLAITGYIYRDELHLLSLRPIGKPETPPAPDYSLPASWARLPTTEAEGKADVFYVHPTSFYSRASWNALTDNKQAQGVLEHQLQYASIPLTEVSSANVYAPYYRQATFHATQRISAPGLDALTLAFEDVERAFRAFLIVRDPERPIIIIGEGQGALHAATLLKTFISGENNALKKKLAVAYLSNWPVDPEVVELAVLETCDSGEIFRCVISADDRANTDWPGKNIVQFVWRSGSYVAAVPNTPALVAPAPFNMNARVDALLAALEEEAQILAPIENAIEIGDSPINKVPD